MMSIQFFTNKINNDDNFVFLKIGDGEIISMQFKEGENIDGHKYSEDLGNDNIEGYKYLTSMGAYISDWYSSNPPKNPHDFPNFEFFNKFNNENNLKPNFISPFEILMTQKNKLGDSNLLEFYKIIANSKRKKIYVGPERLKGICNYLKIDDYVTIPLVNAYDEKDKIYENIKNVLVDDCIILFSVGLQSPGLIGSLHKFKNNITLIDIGSGFDSLIVGNTRWGQPTIQQSKNYYKELLN